MDKLLLDKVELNELQVFITGQSERFTEPVVMLEILDHFACKVEEIRTDSPDLSFADVIWTAYASFGRDGFSPIADYVERGILKRYQQRYKTMLTSTILSVQGILILAIGMLAFQMMKWIQNKHSDNFGIIALLGCIQLMFVIDITIIKVFKRNKFKNYKLFSDCLKRSESVLLHGIMFIIFPFTDLAQSKIGCIFFPFIIVCLMSNHIIQWKLINSAREEVNIIKDQVLQIS